ncbi:MAG: hypothetical protein ACTSR3_00570 [Candidatus Helarchaeota archaeon]
MKAKESKRAKKRLTIFVLVIAIVIFTIPLISSTSLEYTSTSEVVIAFDESHDQFCKFDNYRGNFILPLAILNSSLRYDVRIISNGSSINPLNLIGVDILIIGNPGINSTFNQTEINTIVGFVLSGGSLLLMSEGYVEHRYPLNQSQPNTRELNKILRAIGLSIVEFTNQTIRDESQYLYYYAGNTYQIPIPSSSFSPQSTIGIGIDTVLTFSSNINVNPILFSNNIFATGRILDFGSGFWPLSTAGSGTFLPVWLAGFELFSGARVLLCGSTMMFSDISPLGLDITFEGFFDGNETISLSLPWYFAKDLSQYGLLFGFPSFDNAHLWMNMIDWLTISENQKFLPFILSFLAGIIGLIGVASSLLIYAKKRKIKEIKVEITEKEKQELPIILDRAKTLKSARKNLKDGTIIKAIELYQKASKLSSKLKDDEFRKRFKKRANDLRALKKEK